VCYVRARGKTPHPNHPPIPVLKHTFSGPLLSMERHGTVDVAVKRRAGRACALCRSRKVRCDVVRSGPPCTNCQLDSLECIVPRSKRHKYVLNGVKLDLERTAVTDYGSNEMKQGVEGWQVCCCQDPRNNLTTRWSPPTRISHNKCSKRHCVSEFTEFHSTPPHGLGPS
jgi:hypothetical protein